MLYLYIPTRNPPVFKLIISRDAPIIAAKIKSLYAGFQTKTNEIIDKIMKIKKNNPFIDILITEIRPKISGKK